MERVTHFSSPEKPWGKSHTPKLYLHAPFSENLVTMWPNTTILIGEMRGSMDSQVRGPGRASESALPSSAMAILYRNQLPDFKKAVYEIRNDGIPVHTVIQNLDTFSLKMESFCSVERIPTVYTKLTIKNESEEKLEDRISLIARTGREFDLLGVVEPDGYMPQEPSVNRWKTLPLWNHDEEKITDNKYTVYFKMGQNITIGKRDYYVMHFDFTLDKDGETEIYFAFGRGKINKDFDYAAEKQKMINFWETELGKIKVFPQKEDPHFYAMFRSLVAQGLQMFVHPQGMNFVLMRQGGLQRRIWPTENRSMIEALVKIGDFEKYIDAILNTYFNVMQTEDGEIVNFGIAWASVTGAVLDSFSVASQKYPKLYERYKDKAYKAFSWIEKTRNSTREDEKLVSGLFPPMKASDYPGVCQMWGMTDAWNMTAYEKYAQCLIAYDDPHKNEVQKAAEDYRQILASVFEKAAEEQKNSDVLILPMDAGGNKELDDTFRKSSVAEGFFNETILIAAGIGGYDTESVRKILKYRFENKKCYENGMVLPFDKSGVSNKGRRWYGNWSEYKLYLYYRKIGQDEKAKPFLDAQLHFNMTNEYYMSERYDDCDPWYIPWCPNASANGRTILMLCDWYVDRINS